MIINIYINIFSTFKTTTSELNPICKLFSVAGGLRGTVAESPLLP